MQPASDETKQMILDSVMDKFSDLVADDIVAFSLYTEVNENSYNMIGLTRGSLDKPNLRATISVSTREKGFSTVRSNQVLENKYWVIQSPDGLQLEKQLKIINPGSSTDVDELFVSVGEIKDLSNIEKQLIFDSVYVENKVAKKVIEAEREIGLGFVSESEAK